MNSITRWVGCCLTADRLSPHDCPTESLEAGALPGNGKDFAIPLGALLVFCIANRFCVMIAESGPNQERCHV